MSFHTTLRVKFVPMLRFYNMCGVNILHQSNETILKETTGKKENSWKEFNLTKGEKEKKLFKMKS